MNSERVLSLDISTKTGYTLLVSSKDSFSVEESGQQPAISEPDGQYPGNYVNWAFKCYERIVALVSRLRPDVLVIEETTSGSKSVYSQKILEFIHFLVAQFIRDSGILAIYFMTEVWRREVGCMMSKDEKKKNKEVRDFKKQNKAKLAYDKQGKRIGIVGRKHVNVRRANEVFGLNLKLKDNDKADSLLLAYTYHLRRMRFV